MGQKKLAWLSNFEDDSERLQAFEAALGNLPVGVGLMRMDGSPIFFNRTFLDIYGIPEESRMKNFDQVVRDGLLKNWKEDPGDYFRRLIHTLKQGRDFTAEVEVGDRIIAIHDVPLDGKFILSTQRDVTSRVTAERRIAHLANHDPLTGLPNRAAFNRELNRALADAQAKSQRFAILSVDLDRFKDVNDIFGHSSGDALLQEVARRFEEIVGSGFVARLGGDEFTFICNETSQPTAATMLADRLFEHTTGEIEVLGRPLLVSMSIGIALFPTDGEDSVSLLNNADAALYRAKAEGRGIARFYESKMDARIHEKRVLQQELRLALSRNELVLDYQPQATVDGDVTGFEALVRWHHPTMGEIMPGTFIPLAEETGLIVEMGDWILREASREAASWSKPLTVAVNVSPVQFRHGDLAQRVRAILDEVGLDASRLEIEITEGLLIDDFSRALGMLRRLKEIGVHIAMDDFGVGYSSLSYLQSFPFDKLKIDGSFIAKLEDNVHAREIIRAVIGLGRGLNVPIVAEGVETSEQLAFLSGEHCNAVQGYLIGRPGPIGSFAEALGKKPDMRPEARSGKPLRQEHG